MAVNNHRNLRFAILGIGVTLLLICACADVF